MPKNRQHNKFYQPNRGSSSISIDPEATNQMQEEVDSF